MATAVILPKLGNTVETCLIVGWHKAIGDTISEGDIVCQVETDKATLEVESTVAGTLLATFFQPGDEVPVLTPIAAVGAPGEDVESLHPTATRQEAIPSPVVDDASPPEPAPTEVPTASASILVSPRARKLAGRNNIDLSGLAGTGPGGRIIERDVQAALDAQPSLTPVARRMVASGHYQMPETGSDPGGRVTADQLVPLAPPPHPESSSDEVEIIPLRGARKVIAARMLESLQTTAQLTLQASADARALLDYRRRLKTSDPELGLHPITINDLLLFAVSRTLPAHPALNALFADEAIIQHRRVHLAFAVDTPRGLLVPVIRDADRLSLQQMAAEVKRLAEAATAGDINPDDLQGGTFTVTNLGSLGVESFTPVLNPPQVGILGVGNINLKPVEVDGEVAFIPHLGLSLTINHQVVDGAPGARFLQTLAHHLSQIDLTLAL